MSGERAPIRSICVVGAGTVGLSAALAFARALPRVRVELIETQADPAALADRLPRTLPHIHRFHAAIGLDERVLVAGGEATPLIGTRFRNWSARGEPWFQIFGEHGLPVGGAAFHAVWQRARAAGRALPFHFYAAPGALAEAGKFIHPAPDPNSPFGTFLYALRLDPERYRARLRRAAEHLPVTTGEVADVERRVDGGIEAVRLTDGRRVAADLYVDATGPKASLLARIDDAFESWGEWLPCDRLRFGDEPARAPQPLDEMTASAAGWILRSPLPERTLVCEASASALDDAANAVAIRPGRRPVPWLRNVLAIGDASAVLDPLGGANLHLAHSAILRAIDLLPGRDMHELELREYNRRTGQETDRARDFAALHYLRSGHSDGMWAELAHRRPPPSLARTLEQFERRGRLPFFEEESFDSGSWLGALLGLGVMAHHVDPAATGVDLDRAVSAMDAFARGLRQVAADAPPYPDYLARMKAARAPAV
jgi:tryptophan 7-halogenase